MESSLIPLSREFYLQGANTVAPALLGKLLVHRSPEGVTAGRIVEVESYLGWCDKGAHSYLNRRTERTEIQFGPGGFAYIYRIYGMHACFNIVTNTSEYPEAVLIRALEPVEGIALMQKRRQREDRKELCNGPGKLCEAMGITISDYGADLCGEKLFLAPFEEVDPADILVSPRINIDYAEECRDYLWRYYLKDNPYVSKVSKRYRDGQRPWKE